MNRGKHIIHGDIQNGCRYIESTRTRGKKGTTKLSSRTAFVVFVKGIENTKTSSQLELNLLNELPYYRGNVFPPRLRNNIKYPGE